MINRVKYLFEEYGNKYKNNINKLLYINGSIVNIKEFIIIILYINYLIFININKYIY